MSWVLEGFPTRHFTVFYRKHPVFRTSPKMKGYLIAVSRHCDFHSFPLPFREVSQDVICNLLNAVAPVVLY